MVPWYTNMKCNYSNSYAPNRAAYLEKCQREKSIGLDDTFDFACNRCGKCCTHSYDVMLSPQDLFNIASELQLTPQEVVDKYCHVYLSESSHFPIIRLEPTGADDRCPLLNGRRCMVHNAKPVVCAMYPLGRFLPHQENKAEATVESIKYMKQPYTCGRASGKQTVREWLESCGVSCEDDFSPKWNYVRNKLCSTIRYMEEANAKPSLFDRFYTVVVVGMYYRYDMNQEFRPQFEANAQMLLNYARGVNAGYYEFTRFDEQTGETYLVPGGGQMSDTTEPTTP